MGFFLLVLLCEQIKHNLIKQILCNLCYELQIGISLDDCSSIECLMWFFTYVLIHVIREKILSMTTLLTDMKSHENTYNAKFSNGCWFIIYFTYNNVPPDNCGWESDHIKYIFLQPVNMENIVVLMFHVNSVSSL